MGENLDVRGVRREPVKTRMTAAKCPGTGLKTGLTDFVAGLRLVYCARRVDLG
jgi:hypothetical protein